jgi:hypothetical protein
MGSERSSVGLAALAFPILTFVGLVVANPPGGNYSAKQVANFVAHGHRAVVYLALYLLLLAAVALLYLVSALRGRLAGGNASRLFSATGFAAGTAWAIGAALLFVVPMGLANGGHLPSDQSVVYLFTQAGFAVIFGAGGILLAFAVLSLAAGGGATLPAWLRWLTIVAGVLGLASVAFFPFFFLLLWSIVFGIWTLASRPSEASAA